MSSADTAAPSGAGPTDATGGDGAPPPPTDERREALLAVLREELGDAVVGSHVAPGIGLWVRVTPAAWRDAGLAVRNRLDCRWFDFLSAIDWLPSPFGRSEISNFDVRGAPDTALTSGLAGGDTRFQVLARVVNIVTKLDVILKADVPDDTLTVPSWVRTYAGANWHERECWEMFGITFDGHPDLKHIYLPGAFEGFPLRKDFPLLAREMKPWPGIVDVEPMPEEDAADPDAPAVDTEAVEALADPSGESS